MKSAAPDEPAKLPAGSNASGPNQTDGHGLVDRKPDSEAVHAPSDHAASFAETALKLGGKSDDEARRTGAIDTADDQVETLFAPQYQTVHSPIHRAVWDRHIPVELFASRAP